MARKIRYGIAIAQEILGEGAPVPFQGDILEGMAKAAAMGFDCSHHTSASRLGSHCATRLRTCMTSPAARRAFNSATTSISGSRSISTGSPGVQ